MAVGFDQNSILGLSTKFFGDGQPTYAPSGSANTAAIPQETSSGVLNNVGSSIADYATQGSPSPIITLLGLALLLLGLKYLGEWSGTAVDPADFHIGAYNVLAVTVTAIVGIATLKLLFNSVHVPGITPVLNFI